VTPVPTPLANRPGEAITGLVACALGLAGLMYDLIGPRDIHQGYSEITSAGIVRFPETHHVITNLSDPSLVSGAFFPVVLAGTVLFLGVGAGAVAPGAWHHSAGRLLLALCTVQLIMYTTRTIFNMGVPLVPGTIASIAALALGGRRVGGPVWELCEGPPGIGHRIAELLRKTYG
jgi:hypothetical protein